jgi:hypothetical protein
VTRPDNSAAAAAVENASSNCELAILSDAENHLKITCEDYLGTPIGTAPNDASRPENPDLPTDHSDDGRYRAVQQRDLSIRRPAPNSPPWYGFQAGLAIACC